ncbi:MAG: hypothetical protein ACI828_001363 [Flavobacteriales bacterium]|jgi:hypothetical protein
MVAAKMRPAIKSVFDRFFGVTRPKSFQEMPRTFILQLANARVVNDQKRHVTRKLALGIVVSRIANMTEI